MSVLSPRMPLSAAAKFCYRLGTGLRAGADLLKLLNSESAHGSLHQRKAMSKLAEGAKRGEQLSDVMEEEKPYFPPLMTAMTRTGEATGKLEQALLTLAEHFDQQLKLRRWFLTSIAWPALQFVMAIGVLSLLIMIMGIFSEIPDILGFGLRGFSGVLWFWFFIAIILGAIGGLVWAYFRNVGGLQNIVPLIYMIPGLGPQIQTITIARFCWTLSLTLGAGLDPMRSIRLALDSTGSDYYRSAAGDAEQAIRNGATLSGAIEATHLFPDDLVQRIEIAEHSGTDAESIEYLTEEYDEKARRAVKAIAGIVAVTIWISVALMIIYFIFKLAQTYFDALTNAGAPI